MRWISRQSRKRQRISRNHVSQGIQEQIGTLAAVKAECHFIEIGGQMLCANVMPRSEDSTLEQGERAFDGISMNVADNINAAAMIDGLVTGLERADSLFVCLEIVSDNHVNVLADVLPNVAFQRSRSDIFGVEETQVAVALTDADHNFLADFPAPLNLLRALARVHVLGLAADKGFVDFHRTVEHFTVQLFHRVAYAVAEIPSRLVAYAERALDLISGHALVRLAQKIDGGEPLDQGQVRIVKDSARRDSKLIITIAAVEEFFLSLKLNGSTFAARAFSPVRPAETL